MNLLVLRTGATLITDRPDAALTPTPPSLRLPIGKLGMIQGRGTIRFTLNGVLRWLIDISYFAGTPTLSVKTTPKRETKVVLQGARLPGTELSADFVLTLQKTGPLGTPADIAFTLGGFHAQVILEEWLAGGQLMQSPVTLSQDVCPLGKISKLAVSGTASARFFPNWRMDIGREQIAVVSGLGSDLPSNNLALKLLAPGDPSFSVHPKLKRTLLTLLVGTTQWDLKPSVTSLPIGDLTAADGLFNRIDIEAGEGIAGDTARELMATSNRADGLQFSVAGGITDLDANPLVLHLVLPVYAIAFDISADHSAGDETFLTARFAPVPVWLTVDGFAMLLGDAPTVSPFEVDTINGIVSGVRCQPSMLLASAPISSATGEVLGSAPLPLAPGTTLPFVAAPGALPGWGVLAAPEILGKRRLSLPDIAVAIVRREDLLSLSTSCSSIWRSRPAVETHLSYQRRMQHSPRISQWYSTLLRT
jgi:hypothetical protein